MVAGAIESFVRGQGWWLVHNDEVSVFEQDPFRAKAEFFVLPSGFFGGTEHEAHFIAASHRFSVLRATFTVEIHRALLNQFSTGSAAELFDVKRNDLIKARVVGELSYDEFRHFHTPVLPLCGKNHQPLVGFPEET